MTELLKKEDSNICYYVNVEKGVVAAVMQDVENSILNEIFDECNEKNKNIFFINYVNWISVPQKLTAKATCHENDEFDLETGMRIARKRLLHKYYRLFRQVLNTINTGIEKDLEPFDELFIKIIGQDVKFSTDVKNLNSKI